VDDGPALSLQAALVRALKDDSWVATMVGDRVYDEPPQHVELPYVRIGVINLAPLRMSGDCTDEDIVFSIEAHSRPASVSAGAVIVGGRTEATRIANAVRVALDDAELLVTGYTLDWCTFTTQAVTRAPDGVSYIANIAFNAALSPA